MSIQERINLLSIVNAIATNENNNEKVRAAASDLALKILQTLSI